MIKIKVKTRNLPLGFYNIAAKCVLPKRTEGGITSYVYQWSDEFLKIPNKVGFDNRIEDKNLIPIWTQEELDMYKAVETEHYRNNRWIIKQQ